MRSSTDTTTKTMLVLALLAALAVLLRLGENLLPLPVQLEQFVRGWSILLLFYVYICSVCA